MIATLTFLGVFALVWTIPLIIYLVSLPFRPPRHPPPPQPVRVMSLQEFATTMEKCCEDRSR